MARCLSLVVAAAVLAACGSAAASSSSSSDTPATAAAAHCGPASATTLAVSSGARVYLTRGVVYGCSPGSSRRYRLGSQAFSCINSARLGAVAAAGKFAAYSLSMCGVDTGSTVVDVRRLSDGKLMSSHDAVSGLFGPESYQSVGSIVVDRNGHVAWIATLTSIVRHGAQSQVIEASNSGVKTLATAGDIDVKSLKLHNGTLTWTAGGVSHSAKLS